MAAATVDKSVAAGVAAATVAEAAGAVTAGSPLGMRRWRPPPHRPRDPHALRWWHVATLGHHAAFCVARVAHTRWVSYDGLARDVHEATALGAVAVLLVWVWLLCAPARGVCGGAPLWVPGGPRAAAAVTRAAIAAHGYYFSFACVWTLWYHPAVATPAHVSGFVYLAALLVQSALGGTATHAGPHWVTGLEMGVAGHALLTAAASARRTHSGALGVGRSPSRGAPPPLWVGLCHHLCGRPPPRSGVVPRHTGKAGGRLWGDGGGGSGGGVGGGPHLPPGGHCGGRLCGAGGAGGGAGGGGVGGGADAAVGAGGALGGKGQRGASASSAWVGEAGCGDCTKAAGCRRRWIGRVWCRGVWAPAYRKGNRGTADAWKHRKTNPPR